MNQPLTFLAQDVVGLAVADSQMESPAENENIFAVRAKIRAAESLRGQGFGRKEAQATIWAAWVRVAKAPGTKAVRAIIKQLKRINIGGLPTSPP